MIIYGYSTRVGKAKPAQGNCPSCSNGPLFATTVFRYFHIYWIPLFPFSRKLALVCSHCKKTFFQKDLQEQDRFSALSQMRPDPFSVWLFTGVFLIVAGIGAVFYFDQQEKKELQAYFSSPKHNDLYIVRTSKPIIVNNKTLTYVVYRLNSNSPENRCFAPSAYAFPTAGSANAALQNQLAQPGGFTEDEVCIQEAKLNEMMKQGYLSSVVRQNSTAQEAPVGIKVSTR